MLSHPKAISPPESRGLLCGRRRSFVLLAQLTQLDAETRPQPTLFAPDMSGGNLVDLSVHLDIQDPFMHVRAGRWFDWDSTPEEDGTFEERERLFAADCFAVACRLGGWRRGRPLWRTP